MAFQTAAGFSILIPRIEVEATAMVLYNNELKTRFSILIPRIEVEAAPVMAKLSRLIISFSILIPRIEVEADIAARYGMFTKTFQYPNSSDRS